MARGVPGEGPDCHGPKEIVGFVPIPARILKRKKCILALSTPRIITETRDANTVTQCTDDPPAVFWVSRGFCNTYHTRKPLFWGSFSWAPEGCPGGPPPRPLRAVIATQTGQFWGSFGGSFGPCPAGREQLVRPKIAPQTANNWGCATKGKKINIQRGPSRSAQLRRGRVGFNF